MNMVNKRRFTRRFYPSTSLGRVMVDMARTFVVTGDRTLVERGPVIIQWPESPSEGIDAYMDVLFTLPDPEPNIERGAE